MMDMTEKFLTETEAKLMTHEEVCAQRYEAIEKSFQAGDKRMTKIEYLLYAVIVAVLFGPGVAAEVVKKFIGV
jgi:hypothetical protein